MTATTSIAGGAPQAASRISDHDDHTRETVRRMDRLQSWTMLGIMGGALVLAVVDLALSANLLGVAILLVLAWLLFRAVRFLVLRPIRAARYRDCVDRLRAMIETLPTPRPMALTWTDPPGALAITNGRVFAVAAETGYRYLYLRPAQIASVKVERTYHSRTKGRYYRNVLGWGGVYRSRTTVTTSAFLEIRYQLQTNGPVDWISIPFGTNRRDADNWVTAITRLRPVTA